MYRKFIGTIAAAAIAITALGTTPVRADEYDRNRAIAALLGLAVVGAIIHKNKRDDRAEHDRVQPHRRTVQPDARPHRRRVQPGVNPRPIPRRVNRRLLPGNCLRSYETRRGTYRGFGQRCMQNNYRFVHDLPNHCLIKLKTRDGRRNAYEARCLRNAGYRLARG